MDLQETLKTVIVPIHREGHMWIGIFGIVAFLLALLWPPLGVIGLVATIWCIYFFRDPNRAVPQREGLVVSPADGLIERITEVAPPATLNMGAATVTRISIFLNVFDVHVNRIPIAGKITHLDYHKGKFLNATLEKSSEENERQLIGIEMADGRLIGVVQIAGLIARRIVCTLQHTQEVKTGERFGIIRFGSRVDIYLPAGVAPLVTENQKAIGGETILADLTSQEPARQALVI